MADWLSGNYYLTVTQMAQNAQNVYDLLHAAGWPDVVICGVLGNMQVESSINPGIWQSTTAPKPGDDPSKKGYGLVQWTPYTNWFDWADANGYAHDSGDGQIARVLWEAANGAQWIPTSKYPWSWQDFINFSPTDDPEADCKLLADVWLRNYERPKNQNQPGRGTNAWYWYNTLVLGGGGEIPVPPDPPYEPPEEEDAIQYLYKYGVMYLANNGDRNIDVIPESKVQRLSRERLRYKKKDFRCIGSNLYRKAGAAE